jgi:hypothetical protein
LTPATRVRVCLLLVALASSLLAADAFAQWSVDGTVEHFSWREHTSPIQVHETGPRAAFGVGYMLPRERGVVPVYRGTFYGGTVDYNGSLQGDVAQAARGTTGYIGTTQGVELRYRWPGAVDALAGLEADVWRRSLGTSQQEDYRTLSMRLGVDHVAMRSSPFTIGGGLRWLLLISEKSTIKEGGLTYQFQLSPGLGVNPFLHVGYRVASRFTMIAYLDGMRLGQSDPLTVRRNGRPAAVVFQPQSDLDVAGVRVAYGF